MAVVPCARAAGTRRAGGGVRAGLSPGLPVSGLLPLSPPVITGRGLGVVLSSFP